jgi:hypothetical protein
MDLKNNPGIIKKLASWFNGLPLTGKLLVAIILMYWISPIDALPGPIDDAAVTAILGALGAITGQLKSNNS